MEERSTKVVSNKQNPNSEEKGSQIKTAAAWGTEHK